MNQQPYIFYSPIIEEFPMEIPGIYNLGGGRQVGKTTLLKQWMLFLINKGIAPEAIAFLSCELIVDEQSLYRIVTDQLSDMPNAGIRYLILDEITYVLNWDKAIKYLADINAFENVFVIISGSDLTMMQEARKRFPGRRGKAKKVDFHFYPLSFKQTVQLKHQNIIDNLSEKNIKKIVHEFDNYLIHGGFLTAINEFTETNSISNRTLATYSDWIRGDVIKHGKKEHFLREITGAIVKHYNSQISWRSLVSALSIDHTQTAIDYVALLESMDAVFVQLAIIEDKLVGAPKKHRKIMFCDPFIFHAIREWLNPSENPFEDLIKPVVSDPHLSAALVESIVATHFRQHYPTYYIKTESEVDVAYVKDKKFWPIEVKWRNQMRPNELKQILKYKDGKIWAKVMTPSHIENTPILPLPLALLEL
jgi:hypothetical protein